MSSYHPAALWAVKLGSLLGMVDLPAVADGLDADPPYPDKDVAMEVILINSDVMPIRLLSRCRGCGPKDLAAASVRLDCSSQTEIAPRISAEFVESVGCTLAIR
jgi:hypothetical protein